MDDLAGDIRVGDNNDVYLCGDTSGSLARENNGLGDFFVARYRLTGKRLWLHQFGTNAFDRVMRMEIGENARETILHKFSINVIADQYESLYSQLIKSCAGELGH